MYYYQKDNNRVSNSHANPIDCAIEVFVDNGWNIGNITAKKMLSILKDKGYILMKEVKNV